MIGYAVIGAQYGDEGKGLMVDYLAHQLGGSQTVVVRSNGGSQAGHTVQTPQGERHVFSHFGSGSFTGARTHLSRFMIVNPIKFREERMKLLAAGARAPRVSVDPNAMVALPLDAFINQSAETFRGKKRHGSCGQGIGETVERNVHDDGFPLTVGDLIGLTFGELKNIRDSWVNNRLLKLGIKVAPAPYNMLLFDDAILRQFLEEVQFFLTSTTIVRDEDVGQFGPVIFEAAQGLALDAEMGAFPYVTRSNTGLKNIVELAQRAGLSTIKAHYMSRAYTTRHGAGPLARERSIANEIEVNDPTNVDNDWQGSLRFAPLDIALLLRNINRDLGSVKGTEIAIEPSLTITCMDQIRDKVTMWVGNNRMRLDFDEVIPALRTYGFEGPIHLSYGPTRDDIAIDGGEETGKPLSASA